MAGPAVNVVVGGASGMGEAVAEAIAARGPLLVADSDVAGARAVASRLGADAVECDVRDAAQVAALAGRVARLGALVVTAGLSPQMAAGATILEVNLAGTARVLDAFQGSLATGSAAVCIASIAGHSISPEEAVLDVLDEPLVDDLVARLRPDADDPSMAYALSKHGVMRLVERLAAPWGARGARILSLSPGVIDTPMGGLAVESIDGLAETVAALPIGRLGAAEEIASVVAFLCSEAASYMTGSDVLVDGGAALTWRGRAR